MGPLSGIGPVVCHTPLPQGRRPPVPFVTVLPHWAGRLSHPIAAGPETTGTLRNCSVSPVQDRLPRPNPVQATPCEPVPSRSGNDDSSGSRAGTGRTVGRGGTRRHTWGDEPKSRYFVPFVVWGGGGVRPLM